MNKLTKSAIIIFAILLADQILKIWVKTNMMLGQEYRIFDWFKIHFVENNGMAFGMEFGKNFGKVFLSLCHVGAVGAIAWFLYQNAQKEKYSIKLFIWVSIIFVILLADQILNIFVGISMKAGQEYNFYEWLVIHFVENRGMAFGLELGENFGKMFLSIFRIGAVVAIAWYLYKITQKEETSMGLIVCVSMIFAGAMGNIIDSAFYGLLFDASYGRVATFLPEGGGYASFLHGKVVDMFYFPLWRGVYPNWLPWVGGESFIFFRPVFNIADASISVGIFTLLIFQKKFLPHDEKKLAIKTSA